MKQPLLILSILVLFSCKAFAQFKEGHYYQKDGTKVEGLLKFHYGGSLFTDKSDGDCTISYKPEKRGKKIKLTTNDICCFVIEQDSFAIIKNFRLNSFATYPQDFAQVIESGKINLYLYYSKVQQGQYGSSTVTDWVIEKDGKADKLTRKKFRELLPVYIQDYPELLKKIDNNELKYSDSETIIKLYNEHMANI